jgi:hypothetical protein
VQIASAAPGLGGDRRVVERDHRRETALRVDLQADVDAAEPLRVEAEVEAAAHRAGAAGDLRRQLVGDLRAVRLCERRRGRWNVLGGGGGGRDGELQRARRGARGVALALVAGDGLSGANARDRRVVVASIAGGAQLRQAGGPQGRRGAGGLGRRRGARRRR